METQTTLSVRLNGATIATAPGTTLGGLLEARGVERRMIAVEHNREILPRRLWDETVLHDGDELEIVTMVGGG
jgi:thiamine biosynthesis protein ThiS